MRGRITLATGTSQITKDNAAKFFCKGFGDDPECK